MERADKTMERATLCDTPSLALRRLRDTPLSPLVSPALRHLREPRTSPTRARLVKCIRKESHRSPLSSEAARELRRAS